MDIVKLSLFNNLFKVAEDTDRKRQEELRQLQEHHQVDLHHYLYQMFHLLFKHM